MTEIGPDEIALYTGLGLIAIGFWHLWRPASFLVPGLVLVWMALPSRVPFIDDGPPRKNDVPRRTR